MRNRRGISLIEVMVAVTLLGMMATVHTVVTLRYAVRNRVAASGVDRAAAVSSATGLFTTMAYSALSANTGCVTISAIPNYRHQRCVTLTVPTANITRVRIIITPANAAFRPDTVTVDRSKPPAGSLFS
ncbi:MAG: prepilin-type N-terminal cleavage/methylation domain-containing protein [Gemmatimonadota bacterium]|nr:prepilin-type N-terminal cleavage/methylation domain-containing protein [Gemmatimonadota bacterium]